MNAVPYDSDDLPPYSTFLVIDVESAGLYGEGFAVGWVAMTKTPKFLVLDNGIFNCPLPITVSSNDKAWLEENVLPALPPPNCSSPQKVREQFWKVWMEWRSRGAIIVADCAYPVVRRFHSFINGRKRSAREISQGIRRITRSQSSLRRQAIS